MYDHIVMQYKLYRVQSQFLEPKTIRKSDKLDVLPKFKQI